MYPYGFNGPRRNEHIHRATEYVTIALPIELRILIAEYGSSYDIMWTEPHINGKHSRNTYILNNFEDVKQFSRIAPGGPKNIDYTNILLTCESVRSSGYVAKVYFDMLSDHTWHRRFNDMQFDYRYRTHPNYTPPREVNLPRDAYLIMDGGIGSHIAFKERITDCARPCILRFHDERLITGTLRFRENVF